MAGTARGETSAWGTDGPISMPVPPAGDAGELVSFGGMAWSPAGLVHDLTEVDRESIYAEAYAPPGGADG
jgi:hypothetical protein